MGDRVTKSGTQTSNWTTAKYALIYEINWMKTGWSIGKIKYPLSHEQRSLAGYTPWDYKESTWLSNYLLFTFTAYIPRCVQMHFPSNTTYQHTVGISCFPKSVSIYKTNSHDGCCWWPLWTLTSLAPFLCSHPSLLPGFICSLPSAGQSVLNFGDCLMFQQGGFKQNFQIIATDQLKGQCKNNLK